MPLGTGAVLAQALPTQPYVVDPVTFNQQTSRNALAVQSFPAPGGGNSFPVQLPQSGIIGELVLAFVGTIVITAPSTGHNVTQNNWPYGLLSNFGLSINGQNDLWSCSGLDLEALRFVRNPAYVEHVDVFPGSVGGGDQLDTAGTFQLYLTWSIPIAMELTTLTGALFAQSPSTNLRANFSQEITANLLAPGGTGGGVIAGTFYLSETMFEVPYDAKGNLVIPDLSRLHGFTASPTQFSSVGPNPTDLIRSAGQLARLFIDVVAGPNNRLSALPSAAASKKIDSLSLQYGGNKQPYVWNPAALLLTKNNRDYGQPAPYDRLVIDTVRDQPTRDAILLQGLTDLQVVPVVDPAVTVSAGVVRLVEETLF